MNPGWYETGWAATAPVPYYKFYEDMFNPNDECSYYMWLLFFKIDNKNQ